LPFWVSVKSIYVDNAASSVIHFSVGFGISEQLPRAAFEDFPICHSGVDAPPENQEEDAVPFEFQGQEEPFEVAIREVIKAAEEEEAAAVAAAQSADEQDPAVIVVEAMTLEDSRGVEETEVSVGEHGTSGETQMTGDDAGDGDEMDERSMDEQTGEDQTADDQTADEQQGGGGGQDEIAVAAA
ncbi:hypothetical protein CLOP_g19979, partial [Closterium sp. NIES-67]